MNFNVDDEYFKDKINYNNLEDNIYTQFAKTMAKNVDIDLAKTPLVDILTGYTRYRILQFKIDKAIDKINQYELIVGYYDSNYDEYDDTYSHEIKDELLDILKEDNNAKVS